MPGSWRAVEVSSQRDLRERIRKRVNVDKLRRLSYEAKQRHGQLPPSLASPHPSRKDLVRSEEKWPGHTHHHGADPGGCQLFEIVSNNRVPVSGCRNPPCQLLELMPNNLALLTLKSLQSGVIGVEVRRASGSNL